jgi:cell division protein FtsB
MMFQARSFMKRPVVRFAYLVAFVAVVSYAVVTLRGPRGLHVLFDRQAQITEMEKRNAALAAEIERKRERIKRLENNSAEQELEIRDRLKLVHPNEKVYIIGQPERK